MILASFRRTVFRSSLACCVLMCAHVAANASNCSSLPNTLTNGTTADATQVMADFNSLQNCANSNLAPTANPSFTGNVGIGTTSPGFPLTVRPTTDWDSIAWSRSADGAEMGRLGVNGATGTSRYGFMGLRDSSGTWQVQINAGPNSYFNGGNIGIGTTSPGWPLSIKPLTDTDAVSWGRSADATEMGRLGADGGPGTSRYGFIGLKDSSGAWQVQITGGGRSYFNGGSIGIGTTSPSYTLHVNGSVAGVGAYNNLSDARLKKNVEPIAGALDILQKLRGVRFAWRMPAEREVAKTLKLPTNESQVGFIAQEVKAVLPEAVTTAEGKDALMSMQESKVVPVLVEAVKELEARNKHQAAAISQLQRQVAELRGTDHRVAAVESVVHRVAMAFGFD